MLAITIPETRFTYGVTLLASFGGKLRAIFIATRNDKGNAFSWHLLCWHRDGVLRHSTEVLP